MIDLQKMRENYKSYRVMASHYEGCEYAHPSCAIEALRQEVETLRRSHESLAERNYLAVHALNESYDEGSPQAMAFAMAILDGDRNAIADAKQNTQKRQERAEPVFTQKEIDEAQAEAKELSETVFWNHPDKGWPAAPLKDKPWYSVYQPEPDWLPAPDTMPKDLAPAQMVEWIDMDGLTVHKEPASEAPWKRMYMYGIRYRPLYSDSGLPLCSPEGLEEWATHVWIADDGCDSVVQANDDYERTNDPGKAKRKKAQAPESHRRPGPWYYSLMKVMR